MTVFSGWDNFYVIVGSSAGALIGLQFVVITLIAERAGPRTSEGSSAFATPSVVHFVVVLLLSAIVSAPWEGIARVSLLWGAMGICGALYSLVVARRMRLQTAYRPVFEDWMFHALLPFAAYATLAGAAFAARSEARPALFAVGAAAVLLLLVGIHNAWDTVTYHVFSGRRNHDAVTEQQERRDS